MEQFMYIMFITNNKASFHLWWKENIVKYQKVSKYNFQDSLQNVLPFVLLLTAPIVKGSHILAGIYFIFPENVQDQT